MPSIDAAPTTNKKYVYPPISLLNKPAKTDNKDNDVAIKNNIPKYPNLFIIFNIKAFIIIFM